ncbi:MAG: DNA topoisomerase IB [Bacteroidota bacterium]
METIDEQIAGLTKRKIRSITNKPDKTAAAVNLVYVHDYDPGITRKRKGKLFEYYFRDKKIVDDKTLQRIKSLVLPPAWENVWICSVENGHLQATGVDVKKRKQYKYHASWNSLRNHTKYYRLLEFGKALHEVRKQLQKDLSLPGLPVEKVLALIVSLMEKTSIRVGNNFYEKLYGSFGLTTLKDKHVSFKGDEVQFLFKGKKGVEHNITLKSKKLAMLVKKCQDIPGKELFQFYDENKVKKTIDSGMVNEYIKKISNTDFSAKDFRTWSGTVQAFLCFKEMNITDGEMDSKKKIVAVLDTVAKHLGNTRTVCKKYYVHPVILNLHESGQLEKYLKLGDELKTNSDSSLSNEEEILLKILETN